MTSSAFDLPGRLAAKAGARLIGRDEEHFAALTTRLDTERLAPGGVDRYVAMTRATQQLIVLSDQLRRRRTALRGSARRR